MKTFRAILYILLFGVAAVVVVWLLEGLITNNLDKAPSTPTNNEQSATEQSVGDQTNPQNGDISSSDTTSTENATGQESVSGANLSDLPQVTTVNTSSEQTVYFSAIGTVQSTGVAGLFPLTSGTIKKVNIEEGDFVHEGDVIVELSGANQTAHISETQLQIAESNLANARASLSNLQKTSAETLKTAGLQLQSAQNQTAALAYDLAIIAQNRAALDDSLGLIYNSLDNTYEKNIRDEQKGMRDIDDLIFTLNAAQDSRSRTQRQLDDVNDQMSSLPTTGDTPSQPTTPTEDGSNPNSATTPPTNGTTPTATTPDPAAALREQALKLQAALDAQDKGIEELYQAIDKSKYGLNTTQNAASLGENQVLGQITQSQSQAQVLDLTLASTKTKLGYTGDSSDALQLATQAYNSTKVQLATALDNATNGVKLAELNAELARSQASALKIKAPFDGVITTVNLYAGQNANPQQAVAEVINPKSFQLEVGIDLKTADRISPTAPALIELGGRTIEVPIKSISLKVDEQTKLVKVRLGLPNIFFKLNQTLKVQLPLSNTPSTIVTNPDGSTGGGQARYVPLDAVIIGTESQFVYINDNGKAKRVEVKIGQVSGDQIEVLSGLAPDAQVILTGAKNLTDGQEINVTNS